MTFTEEHTSPARVVREPMVYGYGSGNYFFADLVQRALGEPLASARLDRHEHEMRIERGEREERTNPRAVLGTGGEFTPPLWAIEKFATPARAGRVMGDLVTNLELPPGWSQVNTPKLTTGADAEVQTIDGQPVTDIDQVTADASSPVVTITGEADASQQLLDWTPSNPGYDGIVYRDLSLAYNQSLEFQMVSGTGLNGQLTGVTKVSGIGSVSGSSATTVQAVWPLIGQICAIVGNNRLLPPEVLLFAPRRYFWIASSVDQSNRPIASPGQGPHVIDLPPAGGGNATGPIISVPAYMTGGILGATFNTTDVIIAIRTTDMLLYESTPKFMVATNPGSGTLQVRLQLRRYVAFVNQKPSAIAVVTALPQPSNF